MNKLENIENFFETDLKIKKLLNRPLVEEPSYDAAITFESVLRETLEDIEFEFNKLVNYSGFGKEEVEKKFKVYKSVLDECGFNMNKLRTFYTTCFANMSEKVINDTKSEIVGYYLFANPNSVLEETTSINEMLHVMHSYVVNNNQLFENIDKLAEKNYESGEQINYYGKETDTSRQIFNSLPLNSNNGLTSILSLSNKTIVMIRDRGHATSMEIEEENGKLFVKYFIPKICNVDMVNNLNGVHPVSDDSIGTIGEFVSTKETIGVDVANFIEQIPTDLDMDLPGISK